MNAPPADPAARYREQKGGHIFLQFDHGYFRDSSKLFGRSVALPFRRPFKCRPTPDLSERNPLHQFEVH